MSHPIDIPDDLDTWPLDALQRHGADSARQATLDAWPDERKIDLGVAVLLALRQTHDDSSVDAHFASWCAAFGIDPSQVTEAVERWQRKSNTC
jgi:hypothetical protein